LLEVAVARAPGGFVDPFGCEDALGGEDAWGGEDASGGEEASGDGLGEDGLGLGLEAGGGEGICVVVFLGRRKIMI
jgi:hypothetical protein